MNLVDFRRLMLTSTAEEWLRGRGPFAHIPRTDVQRFLSAVAWNAMTSVHYLQRRYFQHLQLTAGIHLDPEGDGADYNARDNGEQVGAGGEDDSFGGNDDKKKYYFCCLSRSHTQLCPQLLT